ncbi:digestive cysteine proteinase 2-like isoform X1 [Dermacentor variabilis]|uniref:digestive cysteine proteinase 2-like isoform X1 n=1 Tax=Dermacentor variabilis TaxID=34621 RepID=UPI003F5C9D05
MRSSRARRLVSFGCSPFFWAPGVLLCSVCISARHRCTTGLQQGHLAIRPSSPSLKEELATHVLVFMLAGQTTRGKQAVAYHFAYKYYPSDEEDTFRFNIYCANKLRIDAHNAKYDRGEVSYRIELNELSDMTEEEIERDM